MTRYRLLLILPLIWLAAACEPLTPTPAPAISPTATLEPMPAPPDTAAPTTRPTRTPTPPSTRTPRPTLIPTIDPTTLSDMLHSAFTLHAEGAEPGGYPLRRVTGWAHGFRSSIFGSYRWLDNEHLLLFPITGQEMGGGVFEWTLPVVVNLTNAQVWLPAIDGPATVCSLPVWSDALQLLISTHRDEVLLFDVNGAVVRRFQGQRPLHLSLSGRRLLAGFVWHDLETGRTVDFSGQHEWPMIAQPAWSSDETRLAEGFLYADANTGDYYEIAPNELYPVGRGGPIGCPGVLSWAHWIRNETRVVIEWDVLQDVEGSQKPIIPLIDPVNRTFEDLCVLASLPADACAIGVIPQVSPDGGYMLAGRYLIDLNTFFTRTLPSDFTFKGWRPDNRLVLLGQDAIFMGWSPDGQFALLGQNLEWETRRGEYAVLSVKDGDIRAVSATPIVAPTWSPSGRHLAFLAEDGRALIALDVNTWSARRAELPQPFVDILWQPEGDSPIALANDGSLWWLPDPEATVVMPLTRPLPGVRDVHWSPDGNHLAFVSGTDIYVVSLRDVESPE